MSLNYRSINKYSFLLQIGILLSLALTSTHAQSIQDQARIQYYQSMIEDDQLPFSQKKPHFDSIISYYNNNNQAEVSRIYALEQMKAYYKEGYYLEAYKIGLGIIDSFKEKEALTSEEQNLKGLSLLLMGKCSINLGMHDESISHFLSIIRLPESPYAIEAYSYLGFVFMQTGQMEESKLNNETAKRLLMEADNASAVKAASVVYNNLGGYYYNLPKLDSALYCLNQSLHYYDQAENMISKSFIYHNMAIIYLDMKENSIAEDYLRKAIDISGNEPYNMARYLQNLAFVLLQSNRIKESEEYYFKALEVAENANAEKTKSSVLIELSDIFYKKQQYKKAWEYLNDGMILRDSLQSSQNMEKMSLLSQQLENYRITSEKELLEKELHSVNQSNQKKNIFVAVLFLSLILISIITFVQIKRINRNSVVNIKEKTKDAEDIIRKEFEATLGEKNRKLASNALYLMKTNEILTSLEKSIKQLSVIKDSAKRKEIAREMETVINSYNAGQGWEEFKLYFEQTHPSFYANLNKINPELSKMEQRLCALLVLNMSTKEIAEVTNRSIRTIETLIYRIRKNLNIPSDEKTTQFLRKLL